MGPKKGLVVDENYWRTVIETAILNDDDWKVKVVIIEAAGGEIDRLYLNKFETFAIGEKRYVVRNICKSETIFMVNQLGGEKNVKEENRVFEVGQSYLKEKKNIPPDVQALIIKHLVMRMKDEYLFVKKQRLEVKEGMKVESATMLKPTEVKGTVKVQLQELVPPASPSQKGKQQQPEVEEAKKYNTQLRLRGEEWRDKVYVDDFPIDGPNIYVAITSFQEPALTECLNRISVPITAVVQVRIDPTFVKIPSTLSPPTKRRNSLIEDLSDKSLKFWEDVQQLRIQKDTTDFYKNTAFVIFSPPYWDTETLSGNPDKIYDELCYLLYDIQDLTRQHLHYLKNMAIIPIPEDEYEKNLIKYYHQLIEDLPLESVTIFSILDSLLQTACKCNYLNEEVSKSSLSTAVTLNKYCPEEKTNSEIEKLDKAQNLINNVFATLCKTGVNTKSYRITYGEEFENHKNPIVINYGDFSKYNSFHLGNINLHNIVFSTLLRMPLNELWNNRKLPTGELQAKLNFHINLLLSCFDRTDIETAELERLVHILACRKLFNNRSSIIEQQLPPSCIEVFKKTYLKRSVLAEPLPKYSSSFIINNSPQKFLSVTECNETDEFKASETTFDEDPESSQMKFILECPDLTGLVSLSEICSRKANSHIIDEFEYFEDFSGIYAFQILLDAFNNFNCVNYKYCEITDSFILMFYNSHDNDGMSRTEWRSHLPTPLCLQDFFDFVFEEHFDWIKNEEIKHDHKEIVIKKASLHDVVDAVEINSCINDTDVQMELLMEGSIKHQNMVCIERESPEASTTVLQFDTKRHLASGTDMSIMTKRGRLMSVAAPRTGKLDNVVGQSKIILNETKPFSGYNLGDRRIEAFGRDSIFFSMDGTRVMSKYTLVIPYNLEFISLIIVPGNLNNEFYIHKMLSDAELPDELDICQSFRTVTNDGLIINIKKRSHQVLKQTSQDLSYVTKGKEALSSNCDFTDQLFESLIYHSLSITWPNGLITESVHVIDSSAISHIKQFYATPMPHLGEDKRCISMNGEVTIFKNSGVIEVLKPDSTFIRIKKCEKQAVNTNVPDELPSETSSDKSKKVKGKEKGPKLSKISSKTIMEEPDNPEELKYELIIREFEIIESNGSRQKWIDNIPLNMESLLIRTATDYCLGEIFSRRMDGTNVLLNKDGIQIVTFPDGTRIISHVVIEEQEIFPEWTKEELEYYEEIEMDNQSDSIGKSGSSNMNFVLNQTDNELNKDKERTDGFISVQLIFSIEHTNFTTVTINKLDGKITVDSPNHTIVTVDPNNYYEMSLDDRIAAKFDGKDFQIDYEACIECGSKTTCNVTFDNCYADLNGKISGTWLKMKDSFGKKIVVNAEGVINPANTFSDELLIEKEGSNVQETIETIENKSEDAKSDTPFTIHGKCREGYQAKAMRFFVLKRDLSCSELVHRTLVDNYKTACQWQPWCSINNRDTFGDRRRLQSILTPVHLTETEKWLVESKLADKPLHLTFKDLKKDPGKGFYEWMRPYKRFEPKPMKPVNVIPPRQPRAFILRTLEHQKKENDKVTVTEELIQAILRYRDLLEGDNESLRKPPLLDPRPEDERRTDKVLQALGNRIYEDLKGKLSEDIQMRARLDITNKARPRTSLEEELEGEGYYETSLEEEQAKVVSDVERVEGMSENLKKYWRHRKEEFKEQQFYQYLLREGSVPPYFNNILGGAIWWDLNNAAGDAVEKSVRRKMKCSCNVEEEPAQDIVPFM